MKHIECHIIHDGDKIAQTVVYHPMKEQLPFTGSVLKLVNPHDKKLHEAICKRIGKDNSAILYLEVLGYEYNLYLNDDFGTKGYDTREPEHDIMFPIMITKPVSHKEYWEKWWTV